jgi:hypothetical protein
MALDRAERNPASIERRRVGAAAIARSATVQAAPSALRALRQRLGNQATLALVNRASNGSDAVGRGLAPRESLEAVRTDAIQAELMISHPADASEREADQVADAVMRMSESGLRSTNICPTCASMRPASVQRVCADCDDDVPQREATGNPPITRGVRPLQRKEELAATPQVTPSVAADVRGLHGGGSPLPAATRAFFEPRFDADLSHVRVHTGTRAEGLADDIGAKAFTVGRDIAFGAGQFAPESPEGQRLLAHEITHVLQQDGDHTQRAPAQAKEETASGRPPRVRERASLSSLSTPALQRAPGDFLDDLGKDLGDLGKRLAKGAEERVRQELRALGALPGTGAVFSKSGCPKNFCDPFADVSQAKVNLLLVAPVLLAGIAKVVSPRVVPLWKDYLFGGSGPQNLTSSFGKDFTRSKTTEITASFIRDQMKIEIRANHKKILPSMGPATVDLTPRMPKTLAAIDKPGGPHAMDFNIIGEVAGNIAGGIGKDQLRNSIGAKPSPFDDDRTATITAELTRTATGIKVKPNIVFKIHDTIDLCPGNCGAITEQDATIPMSRFEATGLSGDVPFEIEFPAPASALGEFNIPIGGPSPVKLKGGPKPPGKSTAPPKSKSGGKSSALSGFEPPNKLLALDDVDEVIHSFEDAGQDLSAETGMAGA